MNNIADLEEEAPVTKGQGENKDSDAEEDDDDSDDDSNEESDDDESILDTSEEEEGENDAKKGGDMKRKKNDNTKNFHPITNFPDMQKQLTNKIYKFSKMAFGTNHGAGVDHDGLLYTWGHN